MIREALPADLDDLARLATELGYPTNPEQIARRLAALLASPDHAVFVVETAEQAVVGFLHVGIGRTLESEARAEIYGLVVDRDQRNAGLGAELVARAIAWAEERGSAQLRVRSNVVRDEAHRFYERLGFRTTKTQRVFDRPRS